MSEQYRFLFRPDEPIEKIVFLQKEVSETAFCFRIGNDTGGRQCVEIEKGRTDDGKKEMWLSVWKKEINLYRLHRFFSLWCITEQVYHYGRYVTAENKKMTHWLELPDPLDLSFVFSDEKSIYQLALKKIYEEIGKGGINSVGSGGKEDGSK